MTTSHLDRESFPPNADGNVIHCTSCQSQIDGSHVPGCPVGPRVQWDAHWPNGERHSQINAAMSEAWEAMDRAYYRSASNGELRANVDAVISALAKVRDHLRFNYATATTGPSQAAGHMTRR